MTDLVSDSPSTTSSGAGASATPVAETAPRSGAAGGAALPEVTQRPFRQTEDDYVRVVEISNENYPDHPYTIEELRHDDASWNYAKYDKLRLMAEDEAGRVIGYGEIGHMSHQFHPQKFWLEVYVEPAVQGRGYGSAIYERMLAELRRRDAIAARAATKESMTRIVDWLTARGFVEAQRAWESRLDVASFDFAAFAQAEPRALAHGIAITTLGAELAQGDRETVLRAIYETTEACNRDVPSVDAYTERTYEDFVRRTIEGPDILPDAYFLAKDCAPDCPSRAGGACTGFVAGGSGRQTACRYAALSALWKSSAGPDVLSQGLTGVLRDYRGKGVAMALKVRGARYAAERGMREIRTHNDTRNRAMLRINEAMGFARQPAWIVFQKELG